MQQADRVPASTRPPKRKPGQDLVPEDFQLKFWIFGVLYLVVLALQAGFGPVPGLKFVYMLLLIAFAVETLRLLHRTLRLLPDDRRPINPTLLLVLLLTPLLNILVRLVAYPLVAIVFRRYAVERNLPVSGMLIPAAFAAAILGVGGPIGMSDGTLAKVPLVVVGVEVIAVGSAIAFFLLLQNAARAVSVDRHSGAADVSAEVFE